MSVSAGGLMKYEVDTTTDEVVFSSTKRLPFEPKGAAVEARAALRAALATLKPTGHLVAGYASADVGFCDLENVLLYNVGMGSFGALAARSLVLRRQHSSSSSWLHQHRYRVVDASPEQPPGEAFARVAFDLPNSVHGAGGFWWLARRSLQVSGTTTTSFAVDVRIEVPASSRRSLTSLLKPLLDGVLSACHRHDGPLEDVVPRLAQALQASADDVTGALVAGSAPLGARRLVRARGDGVQWNPADDLLTHLVATTTTTTASTGRCVVTLHREPQTS